MYLWHLGLGMYGSPEQDREKCAGRSRPGLKWKVTSRYLPDVTEKNWRKLSDGRPMMSNPEPIECKPNALQTVVWPLGNIDPNFVLGVHKSSLRPNIKENKCFLIFLWVRVPKYNVGLNIIVCVSNYNSLREGFKFYQSSFTRYV